MTPEEQNRLDRISSLRRKLAEINYQEPIPTDDRARAVYFRQLRKLVNLTSHNFWQLFQVVPSTGMKYEQLRDDLRRTCPDEVVQRVSQGLGLPMIDKPLILNMHNIPQLNDLQREFLAYASEHDITLSDLKTFVSIRNLFNTL